MNRSLLSLMKRTRRFASLILSGAFIFTTATLILGLNTTGITLHAKPATPHPIQYTGPDGQVTEIILRGDENGHAIYSTNGTLLEKNPDGSLQPSLLRTAPMLETGKKKYTFSGTHFPSEGEPHALVVLVNYNDNRFSMSDPHDYFYRMLNEEGFSDNGATGSARDFFIENSNGIFRPHFDVYGPLTLRETGKYYGSNDKYGLDMHPDEMCIEVCEQLDKDVDFSIYDLDNDGYIDNLYIFYAGFGEADTGTSSLIWPHSATLEDYDKKDQYLFDGKILNSYGMSNEMDYSYQRPDGIGTFVHEFSHVLGLPDLYATSYYAACTPGAYSTMDMGSYNDEGRTPPYYSLFERMSLGWCSPTILDSPGKYELSPVHLSNDGLLIPTEVEDEFFLLESRKLENNDKFIPAEGMLVWHIDFVQSKWDDNTVNNIPGHQYVDIVEADGRATTYTRSGDTYPGSSNNTALSFDTKPSLQSWGKQSTGFSLSEITHYPLTGNVTFAVDREFPSAVEVLPGEDNTWEVFGKTIRNISDEDIIIYTTSGLRLTTIRHSESYTLPSGLYILTQGEKTGKLAL